mmetsp:Transcript_10087/g.11641  ORF Transcript_10087/g.11641 Transcript_10087/m.11641 type:complete len:92 (+) Transcript_10087:206-481(+)
MICYESLSKTHKLPLYRRKTFFNAANKMLSSTLLGALILVYSCYKSMIVNGTCSLVIVSKKTYDQAELHQNIFALLIEKKKEEESKYTYIL